MLKSDDEGGGGAVGTPIGLGAPSRLEQAARAVGAGALELAAASRRATAEAAPADDRRARHVAIIMDGNGRWASARGLPRLAGHRRGATSVREVVRACPDLGVEVLTLYAFSTENWRRSEAEVSGLMDLFRHYFRREAATLAREGVRVVFIGDPEPLADDIRRLMADITRRTAGNTRLTLAVALNYGGRTEIAQAARRLAARVAAGEIDAAAVDEAALGAELQTADLPDPDLLIRTSGEQRLSNFLLWQAAYAEFVFVDECWPDFGRAGLERALAIFGDRNRRYGAAGR